MESAMQRPAIGACLLLIVTACAACGGGESSANADAGGAAVATATPATEPLLRFIPPESEILDVAVGEYVIREIELIATGPVDWNGISVATTCECLSAEYVGKPTATSAKVRMTVNGLEPEDEIGSVDVEIIGEKDPQKARLASHSSHVAIRRIPFTAPRVIDITPSTDGRFELVVGQAFPLDAKLPESVLDDLSGDRLDTTKIDLILMEDEKSSWPIGKPKSWVLTTRLTFVVTAEDRTQPFETTIPVKFGVPVIEREVKVRWPGLK